MQFLEYMLRSGRLQPVCRKYAGALYGTLSRMAEMPLSEIESAPSHCIATLAVAILTLFLFL